MYIFIYADTNPDYYIGLVNAIKASTSIQYCSCTDKNFTIYLFRSIRIEGDELSPQYMGYISRSVTTADR